MNRDSAEACGAGTEAHTQRILLVDDHEIVREGICSLFHHVPDLDVVAEAGSGGEALGRLAVQTIDLAILDLRMPGMSTVDTIKSMLELKPGIRILVLTSFFEDAEIDAVLRAGAHGYVLKHAQRSDILAAARHVLAGDTWIHPTVLQSILRLRRRPDIPATSALTPRERNVLELLSQGHSNKQIALALEITEGTVKSYLRQIFPKIKVTDRLQAALYFRDMQSSK